MCVDVLMCFNFCHGDGVQLMFFLVHESKRQKSDFFVCAALSISIIFYKSRMNVISKQYHRDVMCIGDELDKNDGKTI